MSSQYTQNLINNIKKDNFKDAINIIKEVNDENSQTGIDIRKIIQKDFINYNYTRILFRGHYITEYYTERFLTIMKNTDNLVYLIINSKNKELIEYLIHIIADEVNYDDKFSVNIFEDEIISLFLSSLMYKISSNELFDVFLNIFQKDALKIIYQAFNRIGSDFQFVKKVINDYFTLNKINRLFIEFAIKPEEYIEIFKYIRIISGISLEEYKGFIEICSNELSFLPTGVLRIIGDYYTK